MAVFYYTGLTLTADYKNMCQGLEIFPTINCKNQYQD